MTPEPGGAPNGGDDPLLGSVLVDRYRLIEKIGEGAMGAVYRGIHETLRKPVAVKLLGRAARADRELVTRFEREAVAAANLKHPNIAEATDSGQMPDGTLFMVMEYVQGRSLRTILAQDGRLPPARALSLLRQIGAAVTFAHGLEVVHRDLKPDNVVVFDRGEERDQVKVIDFGIARMRSSFGGGPSGLTQVGSVVGTVEYMAPEQAMGQAVDARADQYSLGVIAFELLTGRAPYVADDVASLVYMHVGAPIPNVTERAPDLPRAVDDVVAKMMGKLPTERFASVSEALTALAIALERPSPPVQVAPSAQVTLAATPVNVTRGGGGTAAMPVYPAAGPAAVSPHAVTANGTIVTADRPAAALARPGAAPAPAKPSRFGRELPLIVASVLVSVIGLAIVLAIVVSRWGDASDSTPGAANPPPADGPATLATSSHDRGKPKPKPHGRGN